MITGHEDLQKAYQDDRVARQYVANRFETPLGALLHRHQVRVVRQAITEHGVRRVIEVAPGPARLSVDIAPGLEEATLVDSSLQMLNEAARRLRDRRVSARVRLVQADAFNLPLRAECDLVYSFRLIRHFERADRIRLYREMHAILKPGGLLIFDAINAVVSAPIRARAKPGEYEHYDALLRPEEIRQELEEAGFALVSLSGVQHRYPALMKCQVLLAPRSEALASLAMKLLDKSGGEPLEWVVTCRRG